MVRRAALKAAACALVAFLLAGIFALTIVLKPHTSFASHSQCSDGTDNDNDGRTDYPQDDDCDSLDDDNEGKGTSGVFVTLTDDKDKVTAGGNLVYAVTLNQQRDDQRVVNVTLHLPVQANLASASDGGGLIGTSSIRWTNLSVYKNVPRRLTVNVNVSPQAVAGQYIVARVVVDGAGAEATETTLIDNSVQQPLDPSQFFVSITDGKTNILPGDVLQYTVTAQNRSTAAVTTDVRVVIPEQTEFLEASAGADHDHHNVVWRKVMFEPGQQLTFTFKTAMEDRVPDRTLLRARATVGGSSATDQTSVRFGVPDGAVSATITDMQESVRVGDMVTYTIRVKNSSNVFASNVSVDASLPMYGEFVSSTEGGKWDGANVRWLLLPVAPNDTRQLSFTVRIRSDAPIGATLTAGVAVDGKIWRDSTLIGNRNQKTTVVANNRLPTKRNPAIYYPDQPEVPTMVYFPETGADMGSLASILVSGLGMVSAFSHKKWMRILG